MPLYKLSCPKCKEIITSGVYVDENSEPAFKAEMRYEIKCPHCDKKIKPDYDAYSD